MRDNDQELCRYSRELGKALRTESLTELKKFLKKEGQLIPPDEVLEIAMHKMILARTDIEDDIKTRSCAWLDAHGYERTIGIRPVGNNHKEKGEEG